MAEKGKGKSTKKNVKKKVTTKKISKKEQFDSTNILKIIFAILVVVVIVLSIVVIKKKNELKNELKANIVVPIVNKAEEAPFNINLRALNASSETYIFKVTNYSNNTVNKENLHYYIDVQNTTDTKIELTKHGSNVNLLKGQEQETIDCGEVPKDEKESIYYEVKIVTPGKLTKDDYINVKVRAVK